jgi:gentisate 1,2-dioxygenase
VLKSSELVTQNKRHRVVYLVNDKRKDVSAAVIGCTPNSLLVRAKAFLHKHKASALRFTLEGEGGYTRG